MSTGICEQDLGKCRARWQLLAPQDRRRWVHGDWWRGRGYTGGSSWGGCWCYPSQLVLKVPRMGPVQGTVKTVRLKHKSAE